MSKKVGLTLFTLTILLLCVSCKYTSYSAPDTYQSSADREVKGISLENALDLIISEKIASESEPLYFNSYDSAKLAGCVLSISVLNKSDIESTEQVIATVLCSTVDTEEGDIYKFKLFECILENNSFRESIHKIFLVNKYTGEIEEK